MRTSKVEQESFQVGEHTDVLGRVHLEKAWEFCTCVRAHTHTHTHTRPFHSAALASFIINHNRHFPGSPVVRTLHLHYREPRFNPWPEN